MPTKTILLVILAVLSVALAWVLGYQKLNQLEVSPIVNSQPVNNQVKSCVTEGQQGGAMASVIENRKLKNCCSGLLKIPIAEAGADVDSLFTCAKCGNGVCSSGENRDNCSLDCGLSSDLLNNTEYYSGSMPQGQRIKLVNGTYQPEPPIEGVTKLKSDFIVYGDLNSDWQEDAVVVLETSGGGTGVFRDLEVVLNQNGKPFNVAMQSLADRTAINSIAIKSGIIIVDITPKGEARKTVRYKLSNDKLLEAGK